MKRHQAQQSHALICRIANPLISLTPAGEIAAPQSRLRCRRPPPRRRTTGPPAKSPHCNRSAGIEEYCHRAARRRCIREHRHRAELPNQSRFGLPPRSRTYPRGFGLSHAVASVYKQPLQGSAPTSLCYITTSQRVHGGSLGSILFA
jgi:hypothetical protein